MDIEEKIEILKECQPELQFYDEFSEAIVGYCTIQFNTVVIYSRTKVIEIIMNNNQCTLEDAEEDFEYNILNIYNGEGTPGFLTYI